MNKNKHIFLSYRSAEADFALRLAADLKNAGVNLWMDRLDIKPGDDWITALQQAVNDCAAIIAVLSPEYVASNYCKRELARADRMKRRIFPVLLRPVPAPDWPFEIERSQYIDFTDWQDERVYRSRLDELVKNLKEHVSAQISDIPAPETRYLTSLIAELETRKGVLEYVELSARTDQQLDLESVRPKSRIAESWGLSSAFTLLESSSPRETQPDDAALSQRRKPLKGIWEAVEKYPRFVLIGVPGAGKTTTIQRLALDVARARQSNPHAMPIPLLLNLPTWSDSTSPEEFIRSQWTLESDVISLLIQGKVLLYLDGLNEMGAAGPEKARLLREWLQSDRAPKRVIITCRVSDYSGDLNLGLPTVIAEGMDEQRIRKFVTNYLGKEAASGLLTRVLPEDVDDLDNGRHLFQLARNPFMLTVLILVYVSSPNGDLPRNMGSLFKRLVTALWERERLRKTPGWVSYDEMVAAFSDLACAMIEEDMPIVVSREYALRYLGSERLLRAGSSANLLGVQSENIHFFHQLIQEYFAAVGLARLGLPSKLMRPRFDRRGGRIAWKWDQVIIALSGIVDNPDSIVEEVAEVDPYLALECITSGIHVSQSTRQRTLSQLMNFLVDGDQDGRVAAAKVLGALGEPSSISILMDALRDGAWEIRQAATWALREIKIPQLPGLLEALHEWDQDVRDATAAAVRTLGGAAVPVLLEVLHDEPWSMRRGAAWALGEIGDKAAVPGLVEALHDDDGLVRREAAFALGWIHDEAAVPGLLDALHDKDWRVRKAAAETLGWIGKPAVAGLLDALKDTSTNVRRVAAEALGRIGERLAVPALLDALRDENVDVRGVVIEALGWIRDPDSALALIDCLTDTTRLKYDDHRICDVAAEALEHIGTPEALSAVEWWRQGNPADESAKLSESEVDDDVVVCRLIESLNHEDSLVRLAGVKALSNFRSETAIKGLLRALHDHDVLVCDAASESLSRIGGPAVPGLLQALRNTNSNVRGAAIEALGRIKNPDTVPQLIDCLKDKTKPWLVDDRICDMAVNALENIATPDALAAVKEWRRTHTPAKVPGTPEQIEDFTRNVLPKLSETLHDENDWSGRQDAAKSLREQCKALRGMSGVSILARALVGMLHDEQWFVRWAAAEALAWIGDQAAVEPLTGLVRDSNWMVRVAAVRALMEIRSPEAVPCLLTALADDHPLVREVTAEALGAIRSVTALPGLVDALRDHQPFVRRACAEALGAIGDPVILPELIEALHDPDSHVRWTAAEALGKLGDAAAVPELVEFLDDTEGPEWEEKRVCHVAAEALERISTPEAHAALAQWRQTSRLEVERS